MDQNWEDLEKECKRCTKCDLFKLRTNVVFGQGNYKSEILFVGEGPGENEDLQGKPFVGRSGKLLDEMLKKINLSRDKNFYIANIVKCRPPQNRDPSPQEQEICIDWLRWQVRLMKPKIIVALGRIAAMRIIDSNIRITIDHGKFIIKKGIWMMATLHPAAILRNMTKKSDSEEDFLKLDTKIKEIGIKI
ncbi:MAG: uracil-DNA glycosylase [Oscillospiraceae bacterium]|nr:uracil-DNA glycosylase [Oscillospiraceae bacterium]